MDSFDGQTSDSTAFPTDYDYNYIHTERDLEDFTRLDIRLPGIELGTNWFVRLKFGGKLKFMRSPCTGFEYLTDQGTVDQLTPQPPDGTNAFAWYVGEINGGELILPQSLFTNSSDGICRLLMEAGSASAGVLKVELMLGGVRISSDTVYLDFRDITDLYERYTVGNVTTAGVSAVVPTALSGPFGSHFSDEDGKYLLFVHGWNMAESEKYRFAETALKRLYWQGYKGRFGFFTWPTFYIVNKLTDGPLTNYDMSEQNAWKSATPLNALLQSLDASYPGEVRLMAHSMGNVVAGEALNLMGTNQLVHSYAAMQAAIPAHCYDGDKPEGIADYSPFMALVTPNRYAQYWTTGGLPYLTNSAGAGKYLSYFNEKDYALVGLWDRNQRLKPLQIERYQYSNPSLFHPSGFLQWYWTTPTRYLEFPQDTYEIFSFGAQSWSVALGASSLVEGVFNYSSDGKLDLQATYGFTKEHRFHSGQFLSTIVKRKPFWLQISRDLELIR